MDLLAMQLIQVLQFIGMDFQTETIFQDHILSEEAKGGQLFYKFNRLWFVRNESIPGETSLKAIAFDKKAIYLETGAIDYDQAEKIIAEYKLGCTIDKVGRKFLSPKRQVLLEYSEPVSLTVGEEQLEPRIQIKIPLAGRQMSGVTIADRLWSYNAFQTFQEEEVGGAKHGERRMEMRLNLSLQNRLQLEQRPMLLMQSQIKPNLNQSLQGVLAHQTNLLKLQGEELEAYVAEYAFVNGERRAQSILDFVLAGKVKKVKPSLNWIQARDVAKKLVTRVSS